MEIEHAPKPAANSADDEIVLLVQADAEPQQIRVVTSDNTLTIASRQQASAYRAASFQAQLSPG